VKLERKAALVTGAGHRVGRALAVALGNEGMKVAVHYHGAEEGAHETVEMIERAGGEAVALKGDLSTPAGPDDLVDQAVSRLGALDVVVNSAAVMMRTPIGKVTVEDWDFMFALNLRAPFFIAQAAAKVMTAGGSIVNIADLAAYETWPEFVPHAISKAGVVKMTSALARLLAPAVRVNAVAPGAVLLPPATTDAVARHFAETTPLGRLGSPQDVVEAMLYLLRADYVTGETLIVDGGRHVRK